MRSSRLTYWLLAVVLLLPMSAFAGEENKADSLDPAVLLRAMISKRSSAKERGITLKKLLTKQEDTLREIENLYGQRGLEDSQNALLIFVLAKFDTPAAVELLQGMLGVAELQSAEVKNWGALAGKLVKEGAAEVPSPGKSIWKVLPQNAKDALSEAAKGNAPDGKKIELLVGEFNLILQSRDFYSEEAFKDVKVPERTKILFTGNIDEKKGIKYRDVMPVSELQRQNRLLLESWLGADLLAPKKVLPYRGDALAAKALEALAGMKCDEARNALMKFTPAGEEATRAYVGILEAMPGEEITAKIAEYLLSDKLTVSVSARKALITRLETTTIGADRIVEKLLSRFGLPGGKVYVEHVLPNIIHLAAALPVDEAGDILSGLIKGDNATFRTATLQVLAQNPAPVKNTGLLEALYGVLQGKDKKESLAVLNILLEAKEKNSQPLAVFCLDSGDQEIAYRATDVLRVLTNEPIARNPKMWKEWLAKKKN
jgi:hypothetical protein